MVNGLQPIRLFERCCQLCQEAVRADANAADHPFADLFPEPALYFPANVCKAVVIQGVGIRKINPRLINGFVRDSRGVVSKDLAKLEIPM